MNDKRVVKNADGTVTISLSRAVKVEGNEITSLIFRKCQAKHLMMLDDYKGGIAMGIAMIGILAQIPFASAQEIDGDDFMLLQGVTDDFFPNFRLAGARPARR